MFNLFRRKIQTNEDIDLYDVELRNFRQALQNEVAPMSSSQKIFFLKSDSGEDLQIFYEAFGIGSYAHDFNRWVSKKLQDFISDIIDYGCAYYDLGEEEYQYYLKRLDPKKIIRTPFMSFESTGDTQAIFGFSPLDSKALIRLDFPPYLKRGITQIRSKKPKSNSLIPDFVMQNLGNLQKTFNHEEYNKARFIQFIQRFHAFAYSDMNNDLSKISEIYRLHQQLQFLVHATKIRNHLIAQLNVYFEYISEELEINSLKLETENFYTTSEIEKQIEALLSGKATIDSILKFLYPNQANS